MFELEEQILKFPRGRRDDMIDALTDMDEVGFEADPPEQAQSLSGNYFEDLLKTQSSRKKGPIDPFMGENY
jgi:hypothetical protein